MTFVSKATIILDCWISPEDLVHPLLAQLLDDFINIRRRLPFDGLDRDEHCHASTHFDTHARRCRLDLDTTVISRDLQRRAGLEASLFQQLLGNRDRSLRTNCRGPDHSHGRNHTSVNNAITRGAHSNSSPCPVPATISSRAPGIAAAMARECSGGKT